MTSTRKAIISCAITGSIHTPSMSPYLPITPHEIAQSAIEAAKAGAAVVHLHARRPEDGYPTQEPGLFREFIQEIRAACDVVVNITTGGSPIMTLEERLAPALELKPELASLNMGSMNFGLFPMLGKERHFKYEWERPAIERTRDLVFKNTFTDIERILKLCGDNGTRFEFECYDTSHLYNLSHFLDRGLVTGPLFVQNVFGILGGIGTHPEDVMHMKRTADRLFGKDLIWSVLSAGKTQISNITMAALMGGNVRVGLEDSLWDGPGNLARSNAAQVTRIRGVLEGLSIDAATPDETRRILALRGAQTDAGTTPMAAARVESA